MMIDALDPAAALYPSMVTDLPSGPPASALQGLYPNSPSMFVEPPPPELAPEAALYPNSPSMHEATLRAQEQAWPQLAAAIPPAELAAAEAGYAALPATIKGVIHGSGVAAHPDVIRWLGKLGQ